MSSLTIGEVARQAGVGVETVRFYERQGLLAEPRRRASGYRQYDSEAVEVLRFIRRAKELGFTLKEVKGLLALRLDAALPGRIKKRTRRRERKRELTGRVWGCDCRTCLELLGKRS